MILDAGRVPGQASPIAIFTSHLNERGETIQPASAQDILYNPVFPELIAAPIKALDLETTGLDPLKDQIVCISVAMPGLTAIFHPKHMKHTLAPILQDPTCTWLIQHAPFDIGFLYSKFGIKIPATRIYDTRLAEAQYQERIAGKESTSLAAQAKRYLGIDMNKALATGFKVDQPLSLDQATYTALDAQILFPLAMQHLLKHRFLKPDNIIGLQDMYTYVDAQGALTLPGRR